MSHARPLFLGVTRQISSKIESGELAPGDRLPSERWFEEELGVSRTTVRRAIRELVGAGRLEARGRAVYVAEGEETYPANRLVSLTELARARGLRSSALVLASSLRPATLDEADAFQIAPGSEIFELRRLRYLDDVAVALDHNRLPLRFLPRALALDFRSASLYGSLEEAGNVLLRAELRIEARGATEEDAERLGLEPGAPVLSTTEHVKGRDGRIVTIGCTVYRPDRYRFLATYTRAPAPRRPASDA